MPGSTLSAPKVLRARWYLQVEKYEKTITEVCKIFGISRKTYHKWYKKDHPFGKTGKPPRRMHPHTKLTGNLRVIVVEAKLMYNYGPKKMSEYLKQQHYVTLSPSAIYKFYKKKNLIRKPQKHQKWYTPLKEPYYAQLPGENVQLDVKYIPGPNQTWQYQYRFIDAVTNIQFAIDMDHRDSLTTIVAWKRAKTYFPFTIYGIQTDNGGEFRGKFHDYLVRNKIPHRYIPKRSAPWNGKVERANRSVDDEYYLNPTKPWKTIIQYTNWYNHERPHLGKNMNGMTPYQKYLSFCPQV
ncbi:MAG: DDE-type integrase/transposase/recombinase [Patescibacteria group bacterium]